MEKDANLVLVKLWKYPLFLSLFSPGQNLRDFSKNRERARDKVCVCGCAPVIGAGR